MDPAKTSPLFHLCWKWKYDISLWTKPCQSNLCQQVVTRLDHLVSMVLQSMCEANDCLCFEEVYPLVDRMYRFVQPFVETLSSPDIATEITYLEWIDQMVNEARNDLYQVLHHCHIHAHLLK